jgi:hypothetical protein
MSEPECVGSRVFNSVLYKMYCNLQNNPDSFQRFQRSFVPAYNQKTVETSLDYFASRSTFVLQFFFPLL